MSEWWFNAVSATKAIFTERLWRIDALIENHKDKVEGLSIRSNLPKRGNQKDPNKGSTQ